MLMNDRFVAKHYHLHSNVGEEDLGPKIVNKVTQLYRPCGAKAHGYHSSITHRAC